MSTPDDTPVDEEIAVPTEPETPIVAETVERERRSQIDHELPDEEGL